MIYAILAGGPTSFIPDTLVQRSDIQWVGVDRGTYFLLKKGIKPIRAFGDFDSVSEEEKVWISNQEIIMSSFPADKDQTDTELALTWVLSQNPEAIMIYGATGGRLDHGLMNIHLLIKGLENGISMELIDKQNRIMANSKGSYTLKKDENYPYLSFLPFTNIVRDLSIQGVKYPLNRTTLQFGDSLCVSNEIVDDFASYSFSEGTILVIRSQD